MRVAINQREIDGPWGGGNRFLRSLVAALWGAGHEVVHELGADIDIALMLDPRIRAPNMTFGPGDILRHLAWRECRTIVVHRVNECDERKKTQHMNGLLLRANYCADHTVFVGGWLRRLSVWQNKLDARSSVITNGADPAIFHPRGWRPWSGQGSLKLVTHHWGGNWMKGFDIYRRLDEMMAEPEWNGRVEFTYIGNLPRGFSFQHAKYVPPLDGEALADELRSHHAYVTASINEPGGNHQNEGALCGLPLLYRRSGCLPEYCDGFGVGFDEADFVIRLQQLMEQYDQIVALMAGYPHTSKRTCENYLALFDELIESREQIIASRRLFRNPWLFLRNQIPF